MPAATQPVPPGAGTYAHHYRLHHPPGDYQNTGPAADPRTAGHQPGEYVGASGDAANRSGSKCRVAARRVCEAVSLVPEHCDFTSHAAAPLSRHCA